MKLPYDDAYTLDRKLKLEYGLIASAIASNEYRKSLGLDNIKPAASEYDIPKVLNCPNCGAPITGCKCEYCGTVFKEEEPAQRFYADNAECCCERLDQIRSDEMNYNTYESMINAKKACQYLFYMTCCEQEKIYETPKKKSFIRRLLNK